MGEMKYKRPAALLKIDRVLAILNECPRTAYELAVAIPMSQRRAQNYINHLMAERRVYIKRWVRDVDYSNRMYPRAVYAVGRSKNAPQPLPLNAQQRQARAWARIKSDPDRHLDNIMRKRAKRLKPRADVLATFLYGKAA